MPQIRSPRGLSALIILLLCSACATARTVRLPDAGEHSAPELSVNLTVPGEFLPLEDGESYEPARLNPNAGVLVTATAQDPQSGVRHLSVRAELEFQCRVLPAGTTTPRTLALTPEEVDEERRTTPAAADDEVPLGRTVALSFRLAEADERCRRAGLQRARGRVEGTIRATAINYFDLAASKESTVTFTLSAP